MRVVLGTRIKNTLGALMGRKQTGFDKDTLDTIGKHFAALVDYAKEKEGLTASAIYKQIYDDDEISNKEDKISKMKRGESITAHDVMKIQAWKNISLDWLILGKGNPPPELQKGTTAAEKAEKSETEIDASLPPDEDALIESLLSDFKMPVLQTCAALLNLFKYANISIVGNYEIGNFDNPQSLTVKISPKHFFEKGKYVKEDNAFYTHYDYRKAFPNEELALDNMEKIVFWDVRTTLIQCLLATACQAETSLTFHPTQLLYTVLGRMYKHVGFFGYLEYKKVAGYPVAPFAWLSSFSISDGGRSIFPLDPCRSEKVENFKKHSTKGEAFNIDTLYRASIFHDTLSCTLNCDYSKMPDDLK